MKYQKKLWIGILLGVLGIAGLASCAENRAAVKSLAKDTAKTLHILPDTTPKDTVTGDVLVRSHSPVIGKRDAPVTLVEFFDPACGYCKQYHPIVNRILEKNPSDVRVVIRYALLHDSSEAAARLLEAARKQGLYEPVMAAILENQADWLKDEDAKLAWQAAVKAGLDEKRARTDAASGEVDALLKLDMEDAKAVNVRSTPTFYANGKRLRQLDEVKLNELVQGEIQALKK